MKKGVTVFDFVLSVIIIAAIGQLLVSTANILSTQTEKELLNGVKELVYSEIAKSKVYCIDNPDTERDEVKTLFNNSIDINTKCVSGVGDLIEINITGCLGDYCFNHKGYTHAIN